MRRVSSMASGDGDIEGLKGLEGGGSRRGGGVVRK